MVVVMVGGGGVAVLPGDSSVRLAGRWEGLLGSTCRGKRERNRPGTAGVRTDSCHSNASSKKFEEFLKN